MPKARATPATELADRILEYLSPIIKEAEEARMWHTKRDRKRYFEGYDACARATRDAVIRAIEDTVFAELIESGVMERFRQDPNEKAA